MCLVSYIPISDSDYCITSNRDEAPARAAYQIQTEIVENQHIYYPADTLGGSWIAGSDQKRAICLLNGAFHRHNRQLPYRMSRGIMLKKFFTYANVVDFMEQFDFHNIEPFTTIIAEPSYLFDFRWDGEVKHIKTLDRQKQYVWSSPTLYDSKAIAKREVWFHHEMKTLDEITPAHIINVHMAGGEKDRSIGFLMNWDDRVRTISISQIICTDKSELLHIPLEDQTIKPIRQYIHG